MRADTTGLGRGRRLALAGTLSLLICAISSGAGAWCWTQAARLVCLQSPMHLPVADAASATWHVLLHGGWAHPARAFPTAAERAGAPSTGAYLLVVIAVGLLAGRTTWVLRTRLLSWKARSPLAIQQGTIARRAVDRGWVGQRTWARPADLQGLWVERPASGRPYLGTIGRFPERMLAAETEVQPMLIAPPRAGKSSGFVVPWLLDHDGPALVLSTKRDIYEASATRRGRLGRVWIYDPFGDPDSAAFTPLIPAASWPGAIRSGEALASAAHPDQTNAANEFWDKEAASMLAPLLHAAALARLQITDVVRWLDARDLTHAIKILETHDASAASDQLKGVDRRDERNRETTVMSALGLLRAYRHPQLTDTPASELTPHQFLNGEASTIYVVAAGHDQELLRPIILALLTAIYETAVTQAREHGPLQPRLFILMDEAANIAPVRNLGAWLSQCAEHGILIATIWQSIAQIDQRYGRPARDAICAASTAQLFIPPLADPTTTGYLTSLLGEEPVAQTSGQTLSVAHHDAAPTPWLRQIPRGRAILVYRHLPPAIVHAPGWFEDPRFARQRPVATYRPRGGTEMA